MRYHRQWIINDSYKHNVDPRDIKLEIYLEKSRMRIGHSDWNE